jgi:hypothetical protein
MKRLLRFAALLGGLIFTSAGLMWIWLEATRVEARDLPALKTGDIVFQESGNTQSTAIGLASVSLYTHAGLIEMSPDGQPFVVEAVGPVRSIPLAEWIGHGTAGRITIKRVRGLNEQTARKVAAAAHVYDGRPYDFYFYEDREAIYCSELVHLAFKDGVGMIVGAEQQVRDLHIDTAAAKALIEARWRQHPLCRDGKAKDFDTCYPLILGQTLVTPASLARDEKLDLVFTNFGLAAD